MFFASRVRMRVEFRALTSFCFASACKAAIPWPGPANCLKIILRIDPTALGRDGVKNLEPVVTIADQMQFCADGIKANRGAETDGPECT